MGLLYHNGVGLLFLFVPWVFGDTSNTDKALKQFPRFFILYYSLGELGKNRRENIMAIDAHWLATTTEEEKRKELIFKIEMFLFAVGNFVSALNNNLNINEEQKKEGRDIFDKIKGDFKDMQELSDYISKDKLENLRVKWIDGNYKLASWDAISSSFFSLLYRINLNNNWLMQIE